MDAADFFLLRHGPLHGVLTQRLLADLTDPHLRARPEGRNSIIWLLWHVARSEDAGVNVASDRDQVFDEDDWYHKVGAGQRDSGSSMTSEEVSAFSVKVDCNAVIACWAAVGQRTAAIIRERGSEGWERNVDLARVRRVLMQDTPNADIDSLMAFFQGVTRGWSFAHFALTHSFEHCSEANSTRIALGFVGPYTFRFR